MVFLIFLSFVILLRIGELILSKHNEKWLLKNGAVEYGKEHYPFIVILHTSFILSLIIEYYTKANFTYSLWLIILYILLIILKTNVLLSLGKFWNTKIYRVKSYPLVRKGIYKYIKHPNYMIVVAEILIIPLAFHLYYTAIIFSFLNALMLYVRINEENKILN